MNGERDDWWRAAFGPAYGDVYAHRDSAEAAAQIAALLPRLPPRGMIIDAGCGGGRHLAALRAAGRRALGFDFSPALLAAAQQRPACAGRLCRGDLRAPPFARGSAHAMLLLFTVFGYFDEAGNADCLRALAQLLAPEDGMLVLDLPDPERARRDLIPFSTRQCGAQRIEERRAVVGPRIEKEVRLADGTTWTESVRLYDQTELAALAAGAGLAVFHCDADFAGDTRRRVHWLRRHRLRPD